MRRLHLPLIYLLALLMSITSRGEILDSDERLYDLEARVEILQNELAATKALAGQVHNNVFNPSISVVADILGQYRFNVGKHDHNHQHHGPDHHHDHNHSGLMVRELELEFSADIDPTAKARVMLGIATDFDHVDLHVEEAYLQFNQLPVLSRLGVTTKIGQIKSSFGRVGRQHLHHIQQIDFPMAMKTFLGSEGYSAPGVSLHRSFSPTSKTAFNVFLEALFLKHVPMQSDGAEKIPNALAHVWWYQELAPYHNLDVGLTGLLGRAGKKGSGAFFMTGADLHYSYIPPGYGANPLFLFGSELYLSNKKTTGGRWPLGNFTWAQIRLWGASFFGARYDLAPHVPDYDHMQHAASIYLTYYSSEFLRYRLGYEHVMPKLNSFDGEHRVMLSLIFVMGSHPTEPYFVNR